MGKSEKKRQFGRQSLRWEDNIETDLQEIGWGHGLDSSGSRQEKVAASCKRGNKPSGSIKCTGCLD